MPLYNLFLTMLKSVINPPVHGLTVGFFFGVNEMNKQDSLKKWLTGLKGVRPH